MATQDVALQSAGVDSLALSPAMTAQLDWVQQGQFMPERYQGEQRKQYEAAQMRIERQWDNQPI